MDRPNYQIHADLLDQVADSTAERDEVRRILSLQQHLPQPDMRNLNAPRLIHGSVAESDLDAHEKWKRAPFPIGPANHAHRHSRACSRCESGLAHCVTPEACECAEQEPRTRRVRSTGDEIAGILNFVVGALLAGAIVALVIIAAGAPA